MADSNITVDELALNLTATTTSAATSIDALAVSLKRLTDILGPAQQMLGGLSKMLSAAKGATPALKAALKSTNADLEKTGVSAEKVRERIAKLSATFAETKSAMQSGTMPANAALKQMGSIASKTNSEIVNLKLSGKNLLPDSEIAAADAAFSSMDKDVKRLAADLGVVPPAINKASVAAQRFRGALGSFQNLTQKGLSPISPTFSVKLDQAKRALAQMKSQLAALASQQSSGGAFNSAQVNRYTQAVAAAENRVQRLIATANFAKKLQGATFSAGGQFPQAPRLIAPVASTGVGPAPVKAVGDATAVVSGKVNGLGGRITALMGKVNKLGTVGSKSVNTLGGSFIQLRSTIFFAFFAIGAIVRMLSFFIGSASALIEKANLFSVAMGGLAKEANAYGDSISNALGVDPVNFKETLSTFQLMAGSLGMTADAAYKVSRNLTQLTYDYASLMDMDFETVEGKFRSALAGQTRAIAAFGLDVTLSSLKVEALREGIEGNVATFTKANKIILMHNLIIRNSARVQGDLARTILSPANMMRVLSDQFQIAARAIGQMFMPIVRALLPWLIALAQGIVFVVNAFLGLFGIKGASWRGMTESIAGAAGGADDLLGGMEDVAGATGRAAKAAKELRDYTMGLDELNIINKPTDTGAGGGGGGAGGGAGGGPSIQPFDVYDMLGGVDALGKIVGPVIAKFKAFAAVFAPFVTAAKKLWDALKPFLVNVWQGFTDFWEDVLIPLGVWTVNEVGVWLLERLTDVLNWFNENPEAAKNIGAILAAFAALKGLDTVLGIIGKVGGMFAGLFSLKTIGPVIAWVVGLIGSFALWIVVLVALIVGLGIVIYKNWDAIKAKTTEVWDAIMAKTQGLRDGIAEAWNTIWMATTTVWNAIWAAITWVWNLIKIAILLPISLIKSALIIAWNFISTKTKEVWEAVKAKTIEVWESIYAKIKGPLDKVWGYIKPKFDAIKKLVSDVWAGLSSGLQAAWDLVIRIFKSSINRLISAVNNGPIKLLNKIVSAAKALPGGDVLNEVSTVSNIPYLAAGGSVAAGQMFVAGEAGKELVGSYNGQTTVMPLENSGFVQAMASAVNAAVTSAMKAAPQGSGSGDVYIDGVKAGKVIKNSTNRAGIGNGLVSVGTGR